MKTIILTGSTGGLGQALVEALVDDKDLELVCLYRNAQKYEDIFRKCKESISGYMIQENDDFSGLSKFIDNKNNDVVLILNAFSISPIKHVGDYSSKEIEDFIYGNLTRNILLINAVVKICKMNELNLRIINLDSGAADYPLQGWGNYCSAKAYINSFLSVIMAENLNIQIVSFDPGVMDTGMQAVIRATDKKVFDKVDTFISYKVGHKLHKPIDVAQQINKRYIKSWSTETMREKYNESMCIC